MPMASRLLRSGVALAVITSTVLTIWILVGLDGWSYYRSPLAVRGYQDQHSVLRPSGPAGQMFGVVGAAMMLVPFLYMLRKKVRTARIGSLKAWLEVHLYCGIVGPVLVTFHTSFKFNGIVSAAYWSMVAVVLSGIVGRYLYVQIPRTLRGTERTRAELDADADALRTGLASLPEAGGLVARIERLERAVVPAPGAASWLGLLFGEIGARYRLRSFARDVRRAGLPADHQEEAVRLTCDRVLLLRRVAYLEKTKAAFTLWHVFHLPLVWVLLAIAAVHIGLAVYLGYVPFRWSS
jgi:hypothetical protein